MTKTICDVCGGAMARPKDMYELKCSMKFRLKQGVRKDVRVGVTTLHVSQNQESNICRVCFVEAVVNALDRKYLRENMPKKVVSEPNQWQGSATEKENIKPTKNHG